MNRLREAWLSARFEILRRLGPVGLSGSLLLMAAATVLLVLVPDWDDEAALMRSGRLRAAHAQRQAAAARAAKPAPEDPALRMLSSLPGIGRNSEDLRMLAEQAQKHGIELERGDYQQASVANSGVTRFEVQLPVKTDYSRLRAFLADVLGASPNVTLSELRVERRQSTTELLVARVHLTFFYGGP